MKLKFEDITRVLVYVYIASIYLIGFNSQLSRYSNVIFALLLVVFLFKIIREKRIRINDFCIYVLLFATFCMLSSIWAISSAQAYTKALTIISLALMVVVLWNLCSDKEEMKLGLLKIISISGCLLAVDIFANYGLVNYFKGLRSGMRMGAELTNVNTIGVYASIAVIIDIFFIIYKSKKFYILLLVPTLIIGLGTGSKKVILAIICGIVLLYLWKFKDKIKLKDVSRFVVITACFLIIINLPAFSTIKDRMVNAFFSEDVDSSTDKRISYAIIGLNQFVTNPILGIGINNSSQILLQEAGSETYFHNNYVELLACVGIVGFVLFYINYAILIKELYKKIKIKDEIACVMLTLIIVNLVLDVGAVSYYNKLTYIFMLMGYLCVRCRGEKDEKNNKSVEIT